MFGTTERAVSGRLYRLGKQVPAPFATSTTRPDSDDGKLEFWRNKASELNRENEKLRGEKLATEILVEQATALAPKAYKPAPPGITAIKKGKQSPQSAVLIFSDTHIGQVVYPDQTLGLGGYNFDIFLRRLQRLQDSVFSILQDHTTTPVPEIVVAMLGDMLHGNLIHAVEAGQVNTLFDQFYSAGHAVAQFFRNLSRLAPVRVQTVVGNHCVDEATELLTNYGWKRVADIVGDEHCVGLNKQGKAVWQPFHVVREPRVDRMVSVSNRQFDFRGTEHHRFYFRPVRCTGPLMEARWSDITPLVTKYGIEIPTAFSAPGDGSGVPDSLIELTAAVLTDGCMSSNRVVVYQVPRKEAWVQEAFEKSGLKFSRQHRVRKAPVSICGRAWLGGPTSEEASYVLTAESRRDFIQQTGVQSKGTLPLWVNNMTQDQFDRFFTALINGDGTWKSETTGGAVVLYGKSEKWLGEVQALVMRYGWTGVLSCYQPNNTNPNPQYRLSLSKRDSVSVGANAEVNYESGTAENVWCVRTETENFFVRRGGKAYLTGNTRWATQHKMPTDNRYSNLDQFLYAYVQALLRDCPRVSMKLDKQPFSLFEVQGFQFLAGHGDHLKGGDKVLGIPNHAVGRNISNTSQNFAAAGKRLPNYYLFGHMHRPITLPHASGQVIINGGFPGVDGYALMAAFNSSHPSQKFFLMHPKFGQSACYDLRLDLGDPNPHRFSLPESFKCQ